MTTKDQMDEMFSLDAMKEYKITFIENENGKNVEKRKFINALNKDKAIESFKRTMETNYRLANRKPVMKIISCVES